MTNVLMVCLGNICRSPLAEGILRHLAKVQDLAIEVDSCGTANYHVGAKADSRSIKKAKEYGIDISGLRGRQFQIADFDMFDLIYVMDQSNYNNVIALARNEQDKQKVKLILNEISDNNSEVPDPYYGEADGFEHVYQLLDKACQNIIKKLNQC
jgi:protein-tyrosine phosphatase